MSTMEKEIDRIYGDAVASGLLPGVAFIAGDRDGNIIYSKTFGKSTLREGTDSPFTPDTICGIASMTKLTTAVAVMKCVEDGTLDLDQNIRGMIPGFGEPGILRGVEADGSLRIEPESTPVSLRMLLTNTSGQEYEFMDPRLIQWRASRGQTSMEGPTVHEKCSVPLTATPGTQFRYGHGYDWAGRVVEVATGKSLDEFMRERIWTPLGIENDAGFFPRANEGMKARLAEWATLDSERKPPATYLPGFDIIGGATECMGGGGLYASPKAYYTFLSAVFRRDPRLLNASSYDELFRPQLDERCEDSMNEYFYSSVQNAEFLALSIPQSVRKTHALCGMKLKEPQEGRFGRGTMSWAGAPSNQWYMDHETGVCGVSVCQIWPAMIPHRLLSGKWFWLISQWS
ncbi:beta-lactamase/transpeptidase-like protein [Poronia punctata]|nr:beta-lactamase/transpeptidase-like protein [Poronia punctata]